MAQRPNTEKDFWKNVEIIFDASSCWLYKGTLQKRGYGSINYKKKIWLTHRLAWFFIFGYLPKQLNHKRLCLNKSCCRPDHLYEGTQEQNILDWRELQKENNIRTFFE
jgi:hypothetical protein